MILGIICILYYIIICVHMKRWDSRFPRFWLFLGCAVLVFEWNKELLSKRVLVGIRSVEVILLIFFIAVELLILSGIRISDSARNCDYVIVLGAKVNGYRLSSALKKRLDRAAGYLYEHPETKVIVSGGQGHGELVTEGLAMAEYLQDIGIEPGRILREEKSTTTRENLAYSGKILLSDQGKAHKSSLEDVDVGIVTNDFHMYRAVHIAKQIGYGSVLALAAPTNRVMFVNYMTREFFGVLKMWIHRKRKD